MTKKKWIFCTETTYLKILKAKDQLKASQPSHDSDNLNRLATFITGPCKGLHSSKLTSANWIIRKYRKLHIRICFARFSQIQLQQLFTGKELIVLKSLSAVVVLYLTASEIQKLSQCTGKQNYVINTLTIITWAKEKWSKKSVLLG